MSATEPPSTDDPAQSGPARETTARETTGCEIALANPGRYGQVAARRLRPWLRSVVGALEPAADSLAVRFVSDREMRRLNRRYRRRDRPTDVLSFPGDLATGDAPGDVVPRMPGMPWHLGDVVIAVPTARRQAAARGHGLERELKTLLLHGLLHCLGHDHETDDGRMERLERRLRARWIGDG